MIALPRRRELLLEWICPLPLLAVTFLSGILFGGAGWWFQPLAIAGVGLSLGAGVLSIGWKRDRLFLASPWLFLLVGLCGWAIVQIMPLPQSIVGRISPASYQVFALGQAPIPLTDENSLLNQNDAANSRITISLNRSTGLRRLLVLATGVGVFWFFGRWTDRQSKLIVLLAIVSILGSVNAAAAGLQLLDGSPGLFGLFQPDQRMVIGPGWIDLARSPRMTELQLLKNTQSGGVWSISESSSKGQLGILPGGFVSMLCLESVCLPVMFGSLCFLAQRRGSRFELLERLRERGYLGLTIVLLCSIFFASALVGLASQWFLVLPALSGLLLVSFFCFRADIERYFVAIGLFISIAGLFAGFALHQIWTGSHESGFERIWTDLSTFDIWLNDSLAIWRFSGWTGLGLGAYSGVVDYWQQSPMHFSNAPGGILQLAIELGLPLIAAFGLAALWAIWRFFRIILNTDQEHRCLIGAVLGGGLGTFMAWLFLPGWELPILVLLTAVMAGLADRTLCGAKDLYVEAWE
jgi:hypothetical protein